MVSHDARTLNPQIDPGDPLDDRTVAHYTLHTGPYVGFTARSVLIHLGRFANPATGECWPTQERIADELECSRHKVKRACEKLEAAGIITYRQMDGAAGRRTIYRFPAVDAGWVPLKKDEIGDLSLEHHYLKEMTRLRQEREHDTEEHQAALAEKNAWIDELEQMVASLNGTGELPTLTGNHEANLDIHSPARAGKKEEEEEGIMSHDAISSSSPSSSPSEANVQKNVTFTSDIEQWVRANWQDISKAPGRRTGWEDIGAAVGFYLKNPDRFTQDQRNQVARREQVPASAAPAPQPPAKLDREIDPAASAMWNEALDALRVQVPKPTFDTFFAGTIGVAIEDETFIVACLSPFQAGYLEKRMTRLISGSLEGVAGHVIDPIFVVGVAEEEEQP